MNIQNCDDLWKIFVLKETMSIFHWKHIFWQTSPDISWFSKIPKQKCVKIYGLPAPERETPKKHRSAWKTTRIALLEESNRCRFHKTTRCMDYCTTWFCFVVGAAWFWLSGHDQVDAFVKEITNLPSVNCSEKNQSKSIILWYKQIKTNPKTILHCSLVTAWSRETYTWPKWPGAYPCTVVQLGSRDAVFVGHNP